MDIHLLDKRTLEEKNPHEHDKNIVFDEEKHQYTVFGKVYPGSVSGMCHEYAPEFDARKVVNQYYNNWCVSKDSRYYTFINYWKNRMGVKDDEFIKLEICATWSTTGAAASGAGTKTHKDAENKLNGLAYDADTPEMRQIEAWLKTLPPTWEPYRTEWSLYDEESLMCGQLDALLRCSKTGEYALVDWKCVGEMKEEGFRGQTCFPPFSDLPASNLGMYTLQQNIYAYMLRKNYGIDVKSMRLLQVHNTLDKAREWLLPDIRDSVEKAFELRRAKVREGVIVAGSKKRHEQSDEEKLEEERHRKKLREVYKKALAELGE